MSSRVACRECGASILTATADRTGGLCMACKQGIRKNIEDSKRYYQEQRKYDPYRELWKSLVHRVYSTESGYRGLNHAERLYWSVGVLDGEVYNGGFDQFFSNSSGELYQDVIDGLLELKAPASLKLLLRAKEILFPDGEPPRDQEERWRAMRQYPEKVGAARPEWSVEVDELDKAWYEDPDQLGDKLRAFAEGHGLVSPFRKSGV